MTKLKHYEPKPDSLDDAVDIFSNELPIFEKSELSQVFENIDDSDIDSKTGFSKIDFNANLTNHEINCCIIFDELKALGILPSEANLTMQKKRLSKSQNGDGIKAKVTIASAKRENTLETQSGFFSKLLQRRE